MLLRSCCAHSIRGLTLNAGSSDSQKARLIQLTSSVDTCRYTWQGLQTGLQSSIGRCKGVLQLCGTRVPTAGNHAGEVSLYTGCLPATTSSSYLQIRCPQHTYAGGKPPTVVQLPQKQLATMLASGTAGAFSFRSATLQLNAGTTCMQCTSVHNGCNIVSLHRICPVHSAGLCVQNSVNYMQQ